MPSVPTASRSRLLVAGAAAAALLVAVTTAAYSVAAPSPSIRWAPAKTSKIHPGVSLLTGASTFLGGGSQCTANFIYAAGSTVYIGQAAHCSGTGGNTATNGCTSPSLPLGTLVYIAGASRPGVMVYNSWLTMQANGESNPDVCAYNDLALVRIDPADVGLVNPSVPFWGGPVGLNSTGVPFLSKVYSYGNSILRGGISALSPKLGKSIGDTGNGWTHGVYTVTPGIPGDSGSGFMGAQGNAIGVLSTISALGSNNVGDLSRELAYAQANGMTGVNLVVGTQPFAPAGNIHTLPRPFN